MWILRIIAVVGGSALLCAILWIGFRTWPRRMELTRSPFLSVRFDQGKIVVPFPTEALLADVARFDDELSAYLWFDYLRSRPFASGIEFLLTVVEAEPSPIYRIETVAPNDALCAIPLLAELKAKGLIDNFDLVFTVAVEVERRREQTRIFVATYNRPVKRKLGKPPPDAVAGFRGQFCEF